MVISDYFRHSFRILFGGNILFTSAIFYRLFLVAVEIKEGVNGPR